MRRQIRFAHVQLVAVFLMLGSAGSFLLGHEVGVAPALNASQSPLQSATQPATVGPVSTAPASGGLSNRSFAPRTAHHGHAKGSTAKSGGGTSHTQHAGDGESGDTQDNQRSFASSVTVNVSGSMTVMVTIMQSQSGATDAGTLRNRLGDASAAAIRGWSTMLGMSVALPNAFASGQFDDDPMWRQNSTPDAGANAASFPLLMGFPSSAQLLSR
jgi:hypothetical protein